MKIHIKTQNLGSQFHSAHFHPPINLCRISSHTIISEEIRYLKGYNILQGYEERELTSTSSKQKS